MTKPSNAFQTASVSYAPPSGETSRGIFPSVYIILRHVANLVLNETSSEAKSFALRSVRHPRAVARYLNFLGRLQRQRGLNSAGLRHAAKKPLKPYLKPGLSLKDRIELLTFHHGLCLALPDGVLRALWDGSAFEAVRLIGVRGSCYSLRIERSSFTQREGEIALRLGCIDCEREVFTTLAVLTFVFAQAPDGSRNSIMLIGGLQGPNDAGAKDAIVSATRNLKGLRPKVAVLLAAQAIAGCMGCTEIHSISNEKHLINVRKASSRARMHADYDKFWLERGGRFDSFLGFRMPMQSRVAGAFRSEIVASVRRHFNVSVTSGSTCGVVLAVGDMEPEVTSVGNPPILSGVHP